MEKRILILGASGQIGTDLTVALRNIFGSPNVIASDINEPTSDLGEGPFEFVDAMDSQRVKEIIRSYKITDVYNLVAILSASAEKYPEKAWQLNMTVLFNSLNLLKEGSFKKLFWPSSIAVFGSNVPNNTAHQFTITEPLSVYGISKLAGERWCEYYAKNYNLDIRSIRYPGLIGYRQEAGGGTTDYAVEIFHAASAGEVYRCYLSENTMLPMMYMEDAIRGTIDLMESPGDQIKIRSSYNINAMSFSPQILQNEIIRHLPEFRMTYVPDKRDDLAKSWPQYINDHEARTHWGWQSKFNIKDLVSEMLKNIKTLVV